MGTFSIIRLLIRAWTLTSHPIYQAEKRRLSLLPVGSILRRVVGKSWRPILAVGAVLMVLAAGDFLCGGTRHTFSAAIFSFCTVGGGSLILLVILLITYLWPLSVAISASSVIAQERERQTWDVLLTTPLDWRDLILVKLAATLSRLNPYGEIFLWGQAFLIAIIFVLVIGQFSLNAGSSPFTVLELPLVFLTMTEFAIARLQDYVMAGLIGLLASLLSSTRQTASAIALMVTSGMILVRALITALVVTSLPFTSFPALLILLATGPSSVVALAWRGLPAILILIAMILIREGIIRAMFSWLIAHLGDPAGAQKT
ncbi:MAG: hypothetical protein ABI947_11695 [Chloroflexota bacterium]